MQKSLFDRLLNFYNINKEEYEKLTAPVTSSSFDAGHKFDHMEEACELVKQIMRENGKIIVYGDYDADGVMGTSILVKMFNYVNYQCGYYLPNRYVDGYGITVEKAKEIVDKGYSLVITVDNGITAFESIDYLKANGLKVIVLDHHQMQEVLPNADYIIHPTISHFGDIASSGAFVAFEFSKSFLGRFDKYLSTLASISLISDMMPLKEYNRDLLRYVFANYKDGEFKAIDLLKEGEPFNESTIGMKIAPKINAVGRLIDNNSINHMVRYFTTDDEEKLLNYIAWINSLNEERKNISKEAVKSLDGDYSDKHCIVLQMDVKEGLLGLIANHLCSTYHVPSIVFTHERDGELLKGSCRAPEGFNVVEAFNSCSDLLTTAGGHALAGGCSLEERNLNAFEKKFDEICKNTPVSQKNEEYIPLGIQEINDESYDIIQSFSPFGECWKAPLFLVKRIKTSSLMFSRDNKHILSQIGNSSRLVGFSFSKEEVTNFDFVDLVGKLKKSTYRGFTNIEFSIREYKESK